MAGVIGGLGEHFDIDPVLLRLAWILAVLVTGVIPGLIAYLVAVSIVPKREELRR